MQVVWEADTAAFANRKRAARACQQCQKRKKRCHHTFSRGQDRQAETEGLDKVLPNLTHKEPIRFIGDLNPESILADLSTKPKDEQRRIGLWIEKPRPQQDGQNSDGTGSSLQTGQDDKIPCNIEKYAKVEGGRRILTGHQRNYLQAAGAFRVLPKVTQDALVATYVSCVNSVLPIMDCTKMLREYGAGQASIFLIQAICMIACKTEDAIPFLKFSDNGPLIDPIPFARSLHTGLDAAMKADLEPNRITRIQILTLMHLHNDGPAGIEESSTHLSQAIHDSWTAGLHIHMPGRSPDDAASMLWWTLWSLDRLNACIGGRPVMIADRDIDIERPSKDGDATIQLINVWLRLGDLLDKVIEFYRPTAEPEATGWETEFPTFSELLDGIDVDVLPDHSQSILEICYNIVAILSCRAGGPTTASYARRITASDRIQQLLSDGNHKTLTPLPLVPYACSLSLTVAYRDIRDQHKDPSRAKRDLATRCEFLESLSRFWWTADAMAKLGRKALKSLQQPGFRKQSVVQLTNAMEGEVTACKYGPFEQKPKSKKKIRTSGGSQDETSPENQQGDLGSALQLLSDAAAKHATSTTTTNAGSMAPVKPSRLRGIPSSISVDGSLFPNRLNYQSFNLYDFSNQGYNSTNAMNATFPSTASHTHSMPPALVSQAAATPNGAMTTPVSLGHRTSSDSSTVPRNMPYFSAESTGTSTPTTVPFDPTVFDQYQYQFENLDNLFDGFFDLSLPTMFVDPLFDGAAYFNAMAAAENSMDIDMNIQMDMGSNPNGAMGMMSGANPNASQGHNSLSDMALDATAGLDMSMATGLNMNMGNTMNSDMAMGIPMGLSTSASIPTSMTTTASMTRGLNAASVASGMSNSRSNGVFGSNLQLKSPTQMTTGRNTATSATMSNSATISAAPGSRMIQKPMKPSSNSAARSNMDTLMENNGRRNHKMSSSNLGPATSSYPDLN